MKAEKERRFNHNRTHEIGKNGKYIPDDTVDGYTPKTHHTKEQKANRKRAKAARKSRKINRRA